jgi:hypothetical protein
MSHKERDAPHGLSPFAYLPTRFWHQLDDAEGEMIKYKYCIVSTTDSHIGQATVTGICDQTAVILS